MASLLSGTAVAKLVNEGYDKPRGDQELPIDINYQRLAEWLTGRQKLPADWHKRVTAIQAKASQAVKGLPQRLLSQLPGGTEAPLDYFRAKQIRDKLAESADRTLFGGLSGQAGTWDQIVKAYEKGGVFIGEAAHSMVQNVDYEIPYLRKQAAKHNTVITDADRKVAEYERSAASCAASFKQECEKLGIKGIDVRQELRALGRQLPGMLQNAVQQLRDGQLESATAFYRQFIQYAHSNAGSKASEVEVLPNLAEVREGRTSAAAPGVASDAPDASAGAAAATSAAVEIDWGLDGSAGDAAATASAPAVDWDFGDAAAVTSSGTAGGAAAVTTGGAIDWEFGPLDVGTSSLIGTADGPAAPVDISWEVVAEGGGEGSGSRDAADGSAPAISWDIEMTEAAVAAGSTDKDEADAAIGTSDGSASAAPMDALGVTDTSVLRLEHDSDYRSRLMDDLQELRAFLLQRRSELGGGELLQTLLPEAIQSVDKAAMARMLTTVDGAIGHLTDDSLRQLLLITSSQRYLDRLVGSLQRKAGQEAKMLAAASEVAARKQEARAALVGLQPKVAELVERTRHIKAEVEAVLSAAFAPRRVLILGEINNVLVAAQ